MHFACRRLAHALNNIGEKRWINEAERRSCASKDQVLIGMFSQFITIFQQKRAEVSEVSSGQALTEANFDSLVSLLWARQQRAMAFLRWARQPLPWVLGCWPVGPTVLLTPGSIWHAQAQRRLESMLLLLEAQMEPAHVCGIFDFIHAEGARGTERIAHLLPAQQAMMWRAFADLALVCHPAWKHRLEAVDNRPIY